MNKNYEFSIRKTIVQIVPIILKDEDEYNKNEAMMLVNIIWLQIIDTYPKYKIDEVIEELFKVFKEALISESFILNLDIKLMTNVNDEVKQAYLKYPIHDNIHDEIWKEANINRYKFILKKIKICFEKTTPEYICNFLIAKNVLDKMIDNSRIHELISFNLLKNRKGVLYKLLNVKKIKEATNSLQEVKEMWMFYSNILYGYITEDERNRYESLLGERLLRT